MNPVYNRRSFLLSSAALAGLTLLDSCTKPGSDPTPPTSEQPVFAAWGDSLTQGSGGTPYPEQLQALLPGRTIRNFGIGGQTAQQIAARQGGLPIILTVAGNAFAGTSAVSITSIPTQPLSTPSFNTTQSLKGIVNGIACTLTRTATGTNPNQVETYTLTPAGSSTSALPANSTFIPDDAVANKTATQLLWLGRNNVPELTGVVDVQIANCINYITAPARFLVVGVLAGQPETSTTTVGQRVTQFNTSLAAKYGDSFIPATVPTDAEMTAIGFTPSASDRTQLSQGVFPAGLRADLYHLNTLGYKIFANRIAAKLKEKNW